MNCMKVLCLGLAFSSKANRAYGAILHKRSLTFEISALVLKPLCIFVKIKYIIINNNGFIRWNKVSLPLPLLFKEKKDNTNIRIHIHLSILKYIGKKASTTGKKEGLKEINIIGSIYG